MTRFTRRGLLGTGLVALTARAAPSGPAGFDVVEAPVAALGEAMASGRASAVTLTRAYLERIERLDRRGPSLNSIIEVNPDAEAIAAALDEERAASKVRGPLHGVPVVVKDNLDTADRMKTTAGSLALVDAPAPAKDAFVVQRLREAGAVLLGKANLSEWANLRGQRSTSGWSARGGQTRNPYALDRNPSGSSSGSGTAAAASLCAVAIGTETDGSIVSPSCSAGLVGFKPTLGLVSRAGIIPLSHSQDTAGPMARTVADAAVVMDAIAGVDPADPATTVKRPAVQGFAAAAGAGTLEGKRLGVVKSWAEGHVQVARLFREVARAVEQAGATLVEVDLPTPYEAAEFEVLLFELKADMNAYLAARGGPMKDLAALIAFNEAHAAEELVHYGQEYFVQAQARGPLTSPAYRKALATCQQARRDIERLLRTQRLDALVGPTGTPAWLTDPLCGDAFGFSASTPAAVGGCPHLTVPMGFVGPLPVTMSFVGAPWKDVELFSLGGAFERLTGARKAPTFLTTAGWVSSARRGP